MNDQIIEFRFEALIDAVSDPYRIMDNAFEKIRTIKGVIEVDACDFIKLGEWDAKIGDIVYHEKTL